MRETWNTAKLVLWVRCRILYSWLILHILSRQNLNPAPTKIPLAITEAMMKVSGQREHRTQPPPPPASLYVDDSKTPETVFSLDESLPIQILVQYRWLIGEEGIFSPPSINSLI